MGSQVKICRSCGKELALDQPKSYGRRCKECVRENHRNWRRAKVAADPTYRLKEWAEENKRRKQSPIWIHRNRIRVKAWRKANPLKRAAQEALRKARKRKVAYEKIDPAIVIERDKGICYLCSLPATSPSMDHIVPLCKGGGHTYNNIRLACLPCNVAKGTKLLSEIHANI